MRIDQLSMTTRLCIFFSSSISTVLIIFFLLAIHFFQLELTNEFDRSLAERFAYLSRHLEFEANGDVYFRGSENPQQVSIKGVKAFAHVAVFDDSGNLRFKNSKLNIPKNNVLVQSFTDNDDNYRAMTDKVSRDYVIQAAFSLEKLDARVDYFIFLFLCFLPFILLFSILLSFLFAKKALAPMKVITDHAVNINTNQLSQLIPVKNSNDELGQLSTVLNDMFQRIHASFESLRRFTADASHELRTPLTAIRSSCEVAQQKKLNEGEYAQLIGSILEEIECMTKLTDSLLILARGDAGLYKLQKEKLELKALAVEVVDLLYVLAEEKQQKIRLKGAEIFLEADRPLIRQAMMSLIHNAIKYSPQNSVISLEIADYRDRVEFFVEDEGIGISPEHQTKIFERFYRVEKSRNRKQGGFGLGLAIVKWISTLHNGSIRYETKLKGSKFVLELAKN